MSRSTQGFTLLELAVVIVVILVTIGIVLPFLGTARINSREAGNNTQVRGIHQAMVMYAHSNGGWYPGFDVGGNLLDGTVEHRYRILLDGSYFTGEYMISPVEMKPEWTTGPVTSANYSYAMLDLDAPGERAAEWHETLNTEAAVISDRNTGSNAQANVSSIHTGKAGDWRGNLAWNDNHTTFTTTHLVDTRYGPAQPVKDDNLFEDAGGDDAYMIFSGD